jgi:hypothetical protein
MTRETNRRGLFQSVATGLALTLFRSDEAAAQPVEVGPVLRRGDRIDVAGREAQIIKDAYRLGYDYEKRYGGCCQCAVAALQDALPCVNADVGLFRAASCLDGGATPTGIQNCGSFTGVGMVIGYLCGRTRDEIFFGDKRLSQEVLRKVYQRFEQRYGSVLCKDVRAAAKGDCPQVVGLAAQWAAEVLLETFANYHASPPPAASPAPATPSENQGQISAQVSALASRSLKADPGAFAK